MSNLTFDKLKRTRDEFNASFSSEEIEDANEFIKSAQRVHFHGLDSLINEPSIDNVQGKRCGPMPSILGGRIKFDAESGCRRYPKGLLPETRAAMDTLTDEELAQLVIWKDHLTGEFECVGFVGVDGMVTKWADERRALAVAAMEKQVRWEERNAKR